MTNERLGRTYCDSNVFIYAIEDDNPLSLEAQRILRLLRKEGTRPVASILARAECLAGAYKSQSAALRSLYDGYFDEPALVEVLALDGPVIATTAKIAGETPMKLLDAIHVATALLENCDTFVTNDDRLRLPSTLRRVTLTHPADS